VKRFQVALKIVGELTLRKASAMPPQATNFIVKGWNCLQCSWRAVVDS
jgi:hypothetical protein